MTGIWIRASINDCKCLLIITFQWILQFYMLKHIICENKKRWVYLWVVLCIYNGRSAPANDGSMQTDIIDYKRTVAATGNGSLLVRNCPLQRRTSFVAADVCRMMMRRNYAWMIQKISVYKIFIDWRCDVIYQKHLVLAVLFQYFLINQFERFYIHTIYFVRCSIPLL